MPESFRLEIDDEFVANLSCAVCTAPELRVYHIPDFADYVSCAACDSSFVVEEDGERVLYGKISEQYSDTEKVVLKNWVTLSVVARLASAERERKGIALPEVPDAMAPPADEFQAVEQPPPTIEIPRESLRDAAMQERAPEAQKVDIMPPSAREEVETAPSTEEQAVITEPISGKRYRVRIKGEAIYIPMSACVHCFNSPANSRMTVTGSLPAGEDPVSWRRANFRLPLCAECRQRSTALSGAQKNARLQVHLTAMLVGLALVVVALWLGVVDIVGNMAVGLLLAGLIAAVGYAMPLGLMLPGVRRKAPLRETYLVQTTLQVREPEGEIAESYFDFRNEDYAQLFWESNPHSVAAALEELEVQAEPSAPEV